MRRSAGETDKPRSSVWRRCAFMRASQSQRGTREQKLNFRGRQMGRFVPTVCELAEIKTETRSGLKTWIFCSFFEIVFFFLLDGELQLF